MFSTWPCFETGAWGTRKWPIIDRRSRLRHVAIVAKFLDDNRIDADMTNMFNLRISPYNLRGNYILTLPVPKTSI